MLEFFASLARINILKLFMGGAAIRISNNLAMLSKKINHNLLVYEVHCPENIKMQSKTLGNFCVFFESAISIT